MRNHKLDLLRFIGLVLIMLAHVEPPRTILNLRSFDVPLMIVLSGITFGLSYKEEPYLKYLIKRIKRLVFPVWIFLTLYFPLLYLIDPAADSLSQEAILKSYFLMGGIGYVWIIRVFLMVALVAPLLYLFHRRIESNSAFLIYLLAIYVGYEWSRYLFTLYLANATPDIPHFFQNLVNLIGFLLVPYSFYLVPYSLLFAFGLRLPHISTRGKYRLLWLLSACLIGFAVVRFAQSGRIFPSQMFKMIPSNYYLTYGIAATTFLVIKGDVIWQILTKNTLIEKTILFVAKNSLWIYLLHIPIVKVIDTNFALEYAIAFFLSVCLMALQAYLVNQICLQISHRGLKKNLKILLTG